MRAVGSPLHSFVPPFSFFCYPTSPPKMIDCSTPDRHSLTPMHLPSYSRLIDRRGSEQAQHGLWENERLEGMETNVKDKTELVSFRSDSTHVPPFTHAFTGRLSRCARVRMHWYTSESERDSKQRRSTHKVAVNAGNIKHANHRATLIGGPNGISYLVHDTRPPSTDSFQRLQLSGLLASRSVDCVARAICKNRNHE